MYIGNSQGELKRLEQAIDIINNMSINEIDVNEYLLSIGSAILSFKQKLSQILLRPNVALAQMMAQIKPIEEALMGFSTEILEQAEIQIKYATYIQKEQELVTKMSQLEDLRIPDNFNYSKLVSLSNEARQKFDKIQPRTLGQASRISGVNPSDVQILMLYMGR